MQHCLFHDFASGLYKCYQLAMLHSCVMKTTEAVVE